MDGRTESRGEDRKTGLARKAGEALLRSFGSGDALDHPELWEKMVRLAAGVYALELQIDAAIDGSREHVRATERELGRMSSMARLWAE